MQVAGSAVSTFRVFGVRVWLRARSPLHLVPTRVARVTHRRQPRRCRTGKATLADAGERFEVHCAEALLPGLDRLARGDIDLVLLDCPSRIATAWTA